MSDVDILCGEFEEETGIAKEWWFDIFRDLMNIGLDVKQASAALSIMADYQ